MCKDKCNPAWDMQSVFVVSPQNIMWTAEQKVLMSKSKFCSLLCECVAETRSQLSELLSQICFDSLVTISDPVQGNSRYEVVLAD